MPAILDFPRRGRLEESELATRRVWRSKCGRFTIEHVKNHYGLPDSWRVLQFRIVEGWAGYDIVGRHRTKKAAFRTAGRLARGKSGQLAVGGRQCRRAR